MGNIYFNFPDWYVPGMNESAEVLDNSWILVKSTNVEHGSFVQ